jgi:hypothetical protein
MAWWKLFTSLARHELKEPQQQPLSCKIDAEESRMNLLRKRRQITLTALNARKSGETFIK